MRVHRRPLTLENLTAVHTSAVCPHWTSLTAAVPRSSTHSHVSVVEEMRS